MDFARTAHNAQTKLKSIMTPIWDRAMGHRLKVARERMLRTQAELAAVLSTPHHPVSQQQVAAIEGGRRHRSEITWARFEAAMGKHAPYVLIAREAALYDEQAIGVRYYDYRQRAMRKHLGADPKAGETPPRASRGSLDTRIRLGRQLPKKRGHVR